MATTVARLMVWSNFLGRGWLILVWVIALLLAAPVLVVLGSIFQDSREVWAHLAATTLPSYVGNSLGLLVGVGLGVIVIGVSTAWLVSVCRFPGDRLWEWALLIPLATPTYLLAYTYTDLWDEIGFRLGVLLPSIRSLPGAIALFSLTLYPYVYLVARGAFLEQSSRILEAGRILGCNPWQSFWRVALPLARPAVVAGLSLALMETLSDYGTVQYFAVDTFTTGIYRTWFGMGEQAAAAQLAACLMLFVFALLSLEAWSRRQARYYQSSYQTSPSHQLPGIRGCLATVFCGGLVFFGFGLPVGYLAFLGWQRGDRLLGEQFWQFVGNSLIVALVAAGLAVVVALVMAYGGRLSQSLPMRLATQVATLGYAIPGSVIAVGILLPLGQLDNAIDSWARANFHISTGLIFSGTIAALTFAYLVRFMSVAFRPVDSSLGKIKPNLDQAARCLGHSPTSTLLKVHLPLLRGGLITAATLVFVDVMKELPATLIVRPFNFDTLAIRVYKLASDERLGEAAAAALAIVLVGLVPVIILSGQMRSLRRLS